VAHFHFVKLQFSPNGTGRPARTRARRSHPRRVRAHGQAFPTTRDPKPRCTATATASRPVVCTTRPRQRCLCAGPRAGTAATARRIPAKKKRRRQRGRRPPQGGFRMSTKTRPLLRTTVQYVQPWHFLFASFRARSCLSVSLACLPGRCERDGRRVAREAQGSDHGG
jgi:hypothetical protein